MQTQLKRIKVKPIIFDDDDLSIEYTTCGQRSAQWFEQLGKVAIEWFFVAALNENLTFIAKHQRSKSIPLGLEDPIALGGQFIDSFRKHWQNRRIYWKVHTPWYNVASSSDRG